MAVYHDSIHLETDARPSFEDVTDWVGAAVGRSRILNGIAVVYSQHTTCSILIQEDSQDTTYAGTPYLMQDLLDALEAVIPTCRREG